MYCPNCGKELKEGEVCTCETENSVVEPVELKENDAPVEAEVIDEPVMAEDIEEAVQAEDVVEPIQDREFFDPGATQSFYNNQEQNRVNVFPGAYYDPNQSNNAEEVQEEVPARVDYPEGYKIKKKHVAVILAFTLGVFGIHNFYLGYSSKGLAQVLIATIGSLFFGVGLIAVSIWVLIETVLLLVEETDRDSNGFKIMTFEESLAREIKKD